MSLLDRLVVTARRNRPHGRGPSAPWALAVGALLTACVFSPRIPMRLACDTQGDCPKEQPICSQKVCVASESDAAPPVVDGANADDGREDADAGHPDTAPDSARDDASESDADAHVDAEADLGAPDAPPRDTPPGEPPASHALMVVGTPAPTPIRGYTGAEATIFQDACPQDTVVIGFNVVTDDQSATNVVDQLQTVCGALSLSTDGASAHVTMSSTLFWRGAMPGTTSARLCPADQIVVGFEGHALALLDQLTIHCAPLLIAGNSVTVGPTTTLPPAGGPGGTPFPRTDCTADQIAVGSSVGVRTWISAFGLSCAAVTAR